MLEVYEHFEEDRPVGKWIGGSRFRECLESCPDEDEMISTGALTDPWEETSRLHLSGMNSRISASRSAPSTPAHVDKDFKWHPASASSGSESTSPVVSSFLPKLVRRLSGRVPSPGSTSDSGRKLRKRRLGSSGNTSHPPLSPGLPSPPAISPGLSDRGFNLFRQSTREERESKEHPQRPPNRRSFSLPLVVLPKRHRPSQGSASSGHDADVSQDSAMDENVPPELRSFDVLSRRASPKPGGLTLIDEAPTFDTSAASPPLPCRSRIMSSPARPNAREIFGERTTPIQESMQFRRHSVTTPELVKSHSGISQSASSLDTIITTPSPKSRIARDRPSTAPAKCLLPLAASTPSLLMESNSEYTRSSCSLERLSVMGQAREEKDVFSCGQPGAVRVYGEDMSLGSSA